MDYQNMTTEQLRNEQTAMHVQTKQLKQKKRALDTELQRRTIEQDAARKVAAMSPAERAVAAQLIGQAGHIPSGETVGTPGT